MCGGCGGVCGGVWVCVCLFWFDFDFACFFFHQNKIKISRVWPNFRVSRVTLNCFEP